MILHHKLITIVINETKTKIIEIEIKKPIGEPKELNKSTCFSTNQLRRFISNIILRKT